MSGDSGLFHTRDKLQRDGIWQGNVFYVGEQCWLPLCEAKMFHQFEHRYGDYRDRPDDSESSALPQVPVKRLQLPEYATEPRYWVEKREVAARLTNRWDKSWLIGYRRITNATNERALIAAIVPLFAAADPTMVLLPRGCDAQGAACLLSNLNSFVCDYVVRQKLGGTDLRNHFFQQFAVAAPDTYAKSCSWSGSTLTLKDWLLPRVLELTYTAWDLEAFAQDCGWSGPPFRWDEERRFQLRCELDAAFFHLYGLNRDDTAYILDTFPIVRRKDEEKFGTYRTKDRTLEIYDALAEAQRTSRAYVSQLNPAPASIRATHPPRYDRQRVNVDVGNYILGFVGSLLRHLGGECDLMKLVRAYALLLPERKQFAELSATQFGADARRWVEQFTQPVDASWFLPILRGMDNREIIELKDAGDDVRVVLNDRVGPPTNPTLETDVFLVMNILDLVPDKQMAEPVKRIAPKAPRVLIKELEPMFV